MTRASFAAMAEMSGGDARGGQADEHNFRPGRGMDILVQPEGGGRPQVLSDCIWGLVPSWVKASDQANHYNAFNARSETVEEKPSFKSLVHKKRCVVVVDGYFEWKKSGTGKAKQNTPWYISLESKPMFLAGLYDYNSNHKMRTFCILTRDPPERIAAIHNRCPVVLSTRQDVFDWLQCGGRSTSVSHSLCKPTPLASSDCKFWTVSPKVNTASYQGSDTHKPVAMSAQSKLPSPSKNQLTLVKFFPSPIGTSTPEQRASKLFKPTSAASVSPRLFAIATAFERQQQLLTAAPKSAVVIVDLTASDTEDDDDDDDGDATKVGGKRSRGGGDRT